MITYKTNMRILPALLCMLFCVVFMFVAVLGQAVHADESQSSKLEYSDALSDLEKDPDFDKSEYPETESKAIDVLQIAEATGGRLFVYVYISCMPAMPLTITDISISTSALKPKWVMYALEQVSVNGVFVKYLVKDFTVSNNPDRVYDISEMHRLPVRGDLITIPGGTTDKIACRVAKRYTVKTGIDGSISYSGKQTEVVEITGMYAGFLRYNHNVFGMDSCDAHFIAFSTDKQIDKLMQADITYFMQSYSYTSEYTFDFWKVVTGRGDEQTRVTESYGDTEHVSDTISSGEEGTFKGGGWFSPKYTWDRIQTAEQFREQVNLTDGATKELADKEWVLRFKETSFEASVVTSSTGTYSYSSASGTKISEIGILRLMFETDNRVYNLGVVSDIVSPDLIPDNPSGEPQAPDKSTLWDRIIKFIEDNWYWFVAGIVGIVLLIIIMPFLPLILQAVITFISWLFKGLWWLISAPFKWIYNKIKGD